jgi:hypothetical protein
MIIRRACVGTLLLVLGLGGACAIDQNGLGRPDAGDSAVGPGAGGAPSIDPDTSPRTGGAKATGGVTSAGGATATGGVTGAGGSKSNGGATGGQGAGGAGGSNQDPPGIPDALPPLSVPDADDDPAPACGGALKQCGVDPNDPTTGVCVDVTDDERNCGACGVTCAASKRCNAGVCACPNGSSDCSGVCANLTSDPRHCGACGNGCAMGQLCSQGKCTATCDGTLTSCGNACVDLSDSASHCGACNNGCGIGQTCVAGSCRCPLTAKLCANRCVNTLTDDRNCGACGNECKGKNRCVAGLCVRLPGGPGPK